MNCPFYIANVYIVQRNEFYKTNKQTNKQRSFFIILSQGYCAGFFFFYI